MATESDRVPVVLCVDVEPDRHVYPLDNPSPWHGFEQLVHRMSVLRNDLEQLTAHPVRFAWSLRMDPQIRLAYGSAGYVVERYGEAIDSFRSAGDAMGIHPHAWRWDEGAGHWVSDHADQHWVEECLGLSVECYTAALGEPPAYHRYGGGHMNTATMNALQRSAVPIDLTVEPGAPPLPDGHRFGGWWRGGTGDFRHVPQSPYRPDPGDFRRPADLARYPGPWVVPLTSGRLTHPRRPVRTAARLVRRPVAAGRSLLAERRQRSQPLPQLLGMWHEYRRPRDFWDAAFATAARLERPYLAFAIRSDTGSHPLLRTRFEAIVDCLLNDRRSRTLAFMTPAQSLAALGYGDA